MLEPWLDGQPVIRSCGSFVVDLTGLLASRQNRSCCAEHRDCISGRFKWFKQGVFEIGSGASGRP